MDIRDGLYDSYLSDCSTSKYDWLELCKFNIFENYVFNGIDFYKQVKGILMGNCFSSAFANIFLHTFEAKYIETSNIKDFRYIDDLIIFDQDNLDALKNIYPKELVLKKTNKDPKHAHYLDLNISISENVMKIGVCDKRLDFNFDVISLSNFDSNIYYKIFYNIFFSQVNRIKQICNNKADLDYAFKILTVNYLQFINRSAPVINIMNYNSTEKEK